MRSIFNSKWPPKYFLFEELKSNLRYSFKNMMLACLSIAESYIEMKANRAQYQRNWVAAARSLRNGHVKNVDDSISDSDDHCEYIFRK